ncbi:MAG: sigma factor-like helix-turn-helix DNA-binding protein, partial [Clostridia bacterium]
MTKLDKIEMIQLFDLYKGILTDKQCEMLHLFYECDFSLGEIAEQYSISRQAVHDSLSKAESALLV